VLIDEAFGHRDVEDQAPMMTSTICRIASSTKPIIAVAMMLLHEQGAWDFEDPVERFIPEFSGLKVRERDGSLVDPVQPMRMRHLMSHAAGFATAPTAERRQEPAADSGNRFWFDQVFRNTLQGMVDRLAKKPLAFHPGKRFLYGPCCDVQGYIIEKLSGQTLDVFLRQRVFAPLGMYDTGFWVEPDKAEQVASLYAYSGGKLSCIDKPSAQDITRRPSFFSGGGGLFSTHEDYRRFCEMLLAEGALPSGRLLRTETVRKMRQDLLEPQVYVRIVQDYTLPGARFGTNVSVITEPQGESAMYGKNTYSWGGAFGTWFWVDPTNELYATGMVQIRDGGAQHLGLQVDYPDLKKLTAQLVYWGEERGA
jgi:CubicO group peptidase (beta-lactamase class C family)